MPPCLLGIHDEPRLGNRISYEIDRFCWNVRPGEAHIVRVARVLDREMIGKSFQAPIQSNADRVANVRAGRTALREVPF